VVVVVDLVHAESRVLLEKKGGSGQIGAAAERRGVNDVQPAELSQDLDPFDLSEAVLGDFAPELNHASPISNLTAFERLVRRAMTRWRILAGHNQDRESWRVLS